MNTSDIYDVYYLENCPYCIRALRMLEELQEGRKTDNNNNKPNVIVRRWNVTRDPAMGEFIKEMVRGWSMQGQQPSLTSSSRVTFPQIFLNGHMLIGGSTDLQRWLLSASPSPSTGDA